LGITVGVDVGTSATKALVVDDDGYVLKSTCLRHDLMIPSLHRFEHNARRVWRDQTRTAFSFILSQLDHPDCVSGVCVTGIVPSLTAVDAEGVPLGAGILYGDERGATSHAASFVEDPTLGLGAIQQASGFLSYLYNTFPAAAGYWPAQAVASYVLGGSPLIDTTVAMTMLPLQDGINWDRAALQTIGALPCQLPPVAQVATVGGEVQVGEGKAALVAGSADAFCEQLVSGANLEGDVLLVAGSTMIVWIVTSKTEAVDGLWSVPHLHPGVNLLGGPSSVGGTFIEWACSLSGSRLKDSLPLPHDPFSIPVWRPYELRDRIRARQSAVAELTDLNPLHGPVAIRRAAFEASGFVVRQYLERAKQAGIEAKRIIAGGGGSRSKEWMQAIADCTGLPVEVSSVAQSGALGAAYLARLAVGLESSLDDARRWHRVDRVVEPDQIWRESVDRRYVKFVKLTKEQVDL